jgi:hypothetical protein
VLRENLVDQRLDADTSAPCFPAELLEHVWVDANPPPSASMKIEDPMRTSCPSQSRYDSFLSVPFFVCRRPRRRIPAGCFLGDGSSCRASCSSTRVVASRSHRLTPWSALETADSTVPWFAALTRAPRVVRRRTARRRSCESSARASNRCPTSRRSTPVRVLGCTCRTAARSPADNPGNMRAGDADLAAHALGRLLEAVHDRPEQLHELQDIRQMCRRDRISSAALEKHIILSSNCQQSAGGPARGGRGRAGRAPCSNRG